jgi:hypothetical protein
MRSLVPVCLKPKRKIDIADAILIFYAQQNAAKAAGKFASGEPHASFASARRGIKKVGPAELVCVESICPLTTQNADGVEQKKFGFGVKRAFLEKALCKSRLQFSLAPLILHVMATEPAAVVYQVGKWKMLSRLYEFMRFLGAHRLLASLLLEAARHRKFYFLFSRWQRLLCMGGTLFCGLGAVHTISTRFRYV